MQYADTAVTHSPASTFSPGCRPGRKSLPSGLVAMMGLMTLLAGHVSVAQGPPTDPKEFIKRLNEPILEVSEGNRAFQIYFEAYKQIDSAHAGAAAATENLLPDRPNYADALQWASEAPQRAAIDLILTENDLGYNAPNYELFGLPYGEENVPTELADYEFVVYVDDAQLRFAEFAYLPRYEELMALLNAEMHYQAHEGNTDASARAAIGLVRMSRQLSERQFFSEKVRGFEWLRKSCTRIRELIWIYRDVFTIQDLRIIADGLEDLDLDQLKFPQGEVVNLEQIVWQIFRGEAEGDYFADKDKFPRIMAEFESRDQPLLRFEAAYKWRALAEKHATRVEVLDKLDDAFNNWRLRWRWDPYDSTLTQYESEFASLSPIKYAVVTESLKQMETLFDKRIPVYADVNGTACACGILAYMIKEGGHLTPGEVADAGTIPDKLVQIQPAYVGNEDLLRDWYHKDGAKLQYATVVNQASSKYVTFSYYTETPNGKVKLPEHWPILYSIGQNLKDDVAAKHTPDGIEGDIIYWPVVDLMPTEP